MRFLALFLLVLVPLSAHDEITVINRSSYDIILEVRSFTESKNYYATAVNKGQSVVFESPSPLADGTGNFYVVYVTRADQPSGVQDAFVATATEGERRVKLYSVYNDSSPNFFGVLDLTEGEVYLRPDEPEDYLLLLTAIVLCVTIFAVFRWGVQDGFAV